MVTQTACYTIVACFPFEPLEKCMTFKDIFHVFAGSVGTLCNSPRC